MNEFYTVNHGFGFLNFFLIPMVIFDLVLRGFALWKSARNGQNVWFIFLLIVNSMGILPIMYLVLNRVEGAKEKKVFKKSKNLK